MKHVLVFAPFAYWMPHFETDLEIIQTRLDEGWRVTVLGCKGELPSCEPNEHHLSVVCESCTFRFAEGMRWLGDRGVRVEPFFWLTEPQKQIVSGYRKLDLAAWTAEDLKALEVDGSDIGRAAYSSSVSMLREPKPDFRRHASLIRANLVAALISHYSLTNHLATKKPDEFVIFNGRFGALRPALRAAQAMQIPTLVHEQAGELSRYYVVQNATVHDIATAADSIERIFAESPLSFEEKKRAATAWYEDRRAARNKAAIPFTQEQQKDLLPRTFSRSAYNVATYISSEDEFASLTEWDNPHYADQNDGIARILASFDAEPGVRFYVRMHPNLSGLDNSQTRALHAITGRHENVELIAPRSPVSTYALLDACDAVVTFGTTVGAEALYVRKPSLLMGRCFYERLEGLIKPAHHAALVAEIKRLARGGAPPPADQVELGMVKYGFAMQHWGTPSRYLRGKDRYHASLVKDGKETHIPRWPTSLPSRAIWKLQRAARRQRSDFS